MAVGLMGSFMEGAEGYALNYSIYNFFRSLSADVSASLKGAAVYVSLFTFPGFVAASRPSIPAKPIGSPLG